jgi:hypothetical protein
MKVSAQAAVFLQKDTPKEQKLSVVRGEVSMTYSDLVIVLAYMSLERDDELKAAALKCMRELPCETLESTCTAPDIHPRILDILARVHTTNQPLIEKIIGHPNVDGRTLAFIAGNCSQGSEIYVDSSRQDSKVTNQPGQASNQDSLHLEEGYEAAGEEEDFLNKYKLVQEFDTKEKIKMALKGNKEWRTILIRDKNKIVGESVLKNPRITEQEILVIAKSSERSDEIIRIICSNKEWTKSYQLRKALIENHKTPLQYALRFLSLLTEKDLAFLIKSKNVSSVIVTQARRMLTNKKTGK